MQRTFRSNIHSSSKNTEKMKHTTLKTFGVATMSNHRPRTKTSTKYNHIVFTMRTLCTTFLLFCATFCSVLGTSSGQFLDTSQACEGTDSDTILQYSACVGSPELLFLLGLRTTLDPPDATCGSNPDPQLNLFCTLGVDTLCDLCNATDPDRAHPTELIYDNDNNGAATWWQSVSWYGYPTPLNINITFSLGHSYRISTDLTFEFKYGRPQLMILEKSNDYGQTWEPYQYYAAAEMGCMERDEAKEECGGRILSGCEFVFDLPATRDTALTSPMQVICTDQYSNTVRATDTDVTFVVDNRILLLTDSRDNAATVAAYDANKAFQEFLDVTDIRLQLLYPPTDGLEFSAQKSLFGLGKYFYAISNIDTVVICNCNLHGKYCMSNPNQNGTVCECYHNTQGVNCEECKPLYNNRPWRAGSNLPFGTGTANECEKCDCGDHADSCVYDATLGYGTCTDCQDNTAGLLCDICVDGYFRNTSALKSDPNVCVDCNCEPLGTIISEANLTLCSQYADEEAGLPVGQCNCKDNIRGRACDMCAEEFYGLILEPNPGTCKACGCNILGTIGGSKVCEELTGQCSCKSSVGTKTCTECKDMYYNFPGQISMECNFCDCDPGGSTSLVCNKDTGRCVCHPNISGRQCSNPATLFYHSYLDSNSYDAWDASSTCTKTSDLLDRKLFSGRGFQTCPMGTQVVFEGVSVAIGISSTRGYYPTIRYSYTSNFDWQNAQLTALSTGDNTAMAGLSCPDVPGMQVWSSSLTFSPGLAVATLAGDEDPVPLNENCMYQFTLELQSPGTGASEIEIDALLLMPNINETMAYKIADSDQQFFYENCLQGMSALSTRSDVVGGCSSLSSSVSAELNNGALSCSCNYKGSLGSACVTYGGQCNCKAGVGGRQCDRCLPGFYDFTEAGCKACNCDESGSVGLGCDYTTGQCLCKAGVALESKVNSNGQQSSHQCSVCLADYYGFGLEDGCMQCGCNPIGSVSTQCDSEGFCNCKPTITGLHCENCLPGYFGFSVEGCRPCECNPAGTIGSTCHPTVGTCNCKDNVEGDKCDQCKEGFFNMQLANPSGCQPCFCYQHGTQCSSATGYAALVVDTDFTSGRSDGWTTSDPTALNINPFNIRVSQPPNLNGGTFVYLLAPKKFLGFNLGSYSQLITYTMKLDTGLVDKSDSKYLIMIGGKTNMTLYYAREAFEPAVVASTFQATLYESHWMVDEEDRNPTATEFLEILSNIGSIQIKATFGAGTASTFYSIAVETAKIGEPLGDQGYVTTVENCTCDDSTMGLSCEFCDIGNRRSEGKSDPYDICMACDCNGRALECDPETGICKDCQLGTLGDQCQECAANVQAPNCDRCALGYYGFGTELFGGACEACNCSPIGTGNNPLCDNLSGQCACIGNYGSKSCDVCADNFFDYDAGCRACDDCYDGIDSQYTSLAVSDTNITDYVALLTSQDNSQDIGPFVERLTTTQTLLVDLVSRTQAVIQKGEDLGTVITSLNDTMLQLLAVLDGPIHEWLFLANISVSQVELGVTMSQEVMSATEMALTDAHYAITGGDIQQAQSILIGLNSDLQHIENQFNSLRVQSAIKVNTLDGQANAMDIIATETVRTAENAVQVAQEANAIHDNTTSRTAALFVTANEITSATDQLQLDAADLWQRAKQARVESQNKQVDVTQINTDSQSTDQLVINAMERIQQALQIEQMAIAQLTTEQANQGTINNVNIAATQTQSLVDDANATITAVSDLSDRINLANQKAQDAKTLAEQTFTDAQNILDLVQDFTATITAAKNDASSALDAAPANVQSSNAIISETSTLRNKLTIAASDAVSGLSLAEEAFTTGENERMNLDPMNVRANRLNADSAGSLNDINSIVQTLAAANASLVTPAGKVCKSFTADIQTLEEKVTMATTASAAATALTVSTGEQMSQLIADILSINDIDTTDLPVLQIRIQTAQLQFTEENYSQIIANLKQSVEEQGAWLTTIKTEVQSMSDMIDALDSFRINDGN